MLPTDYPKRAREIDRREIDRQEEERRPPIEGSRPKEEDRGGFTRGEGRRRTLEEPAGLRRERAKRLTGLSTQETIGLPTARERFTSTGLK
jgi:hypothetical protein